MACLQIACIAGLLTLVAALNARGAQQTVKWDGDLVFMHVPYNFGHTVEFTRMFPTSYLRSLFSFGLQAGSTGNEHSLDMFDFIAQGPALQQARLFKSDAQAWGHLDKDLLVTSSVTGCGMYFTPQKYWPEDLAKKYFGDKTVFGLLRDPYERLIAMFRGDLKGYGAFDPKLRDTCDVDAALQQMMNQVIESNDPFFNSCTFVPQAEFFDGPYGITLPVDNRRFPDSMNEVFDKHGYTERIEAMNVFHVNGCNNIWAGNLTAETKRLVKKVYARDFELLCKHFGYCDEDENTCITGVYHMCPDDLFTWDSHSMHYIRKQ